MLKVSFAAIACALTLSASFAFAGDQTISTSTVWSGTVTVDGTVTVTSAGSLTIQPGTIVNFVGAGNINFSTSGAFSAQGTAAAPIQFTGNQTGAITGSALAMTLSNCIVSGMAPVSGSARQYWLNATARSGGFSMTNCTISNSGQTWATASGSNATVSGCNVRDSANFWVFAYGKSASVQNNKFQNGFIWTNSATANVSGNTVINADITAGNGGGNGAYTNFVVKDNYIHNDATASIQYGIVNTIGDISNNVIRGCLWNLSAVGGHIAGNVLEAYTPAEATLRGDHTHENICGVANNSVIERNILLNSSYGSIMGLGDNLLRNCTVRNNTIDQRGIVGAHSIPPFYLNHMPSGVQPSGLNIRNNLLLRTGRIYDEQNTASGGYADTVSYVDYNCWAGQNADGYTSSSGRYVGVQITGKVEGDDGFSMHDVMLPTIATFNPASLVNNANFVVPYSDADMLAGTYTNAQLLALYQQAYTPVAGSALINAGSPTDASDPAVAYGQIDIGAIEVSLLPGDTDMDRKVTFADYIVLERNFGATSATWAMGDFNGDGKVTFADYIILEGGFGKSVPEPMTLALLAAGGVALLRRRA